VLEAFRISAGSSNFSYRSVGENFRLIESGMLPVIVPHGEKAQAVVAQLKVEQIPSAAIARELQPYVVQVPPKARQRLIDCGHAEFKEPKLRGDQFVVLEMGRNLYNPDVGLVWEDAEYLSTESLVI